MGFGLGGDEIGVLVAGVVAPGVCLAKLALTPAPLDTGGVLEEAREALGVILVRSRRVRVAGSAAAAAFGVA